jgi:hypothetical protein
MMTDLSRACCTVVVGLALLGPFWIASGGQQREDDSRPSTSAQDARSRVEGQRPSLALRATPAFGSSPLRVRASVEIRGGSDDYQEFYCPTVEWDWGDGSVSESEADCAPYEAGKSTIQRRYNADHIYRGGGAYRLVFRLKQRDRSVAAANATITVRGGSDEFGR